MLPAAVSSLLAAAPCVGFSGSRAPAPASLAALGLVVAALPGGAPVLVGDAAGIDLRVRELVPTARVFTADQRTPQQLVGRAIACVQACAASRGVWCAFPATTAPVALRPSAAAAACFAGYAAGTWSALAFALGLGLAAVVYLPAGVVAPWPTLAPVGAGWFVAAPPAEQLTLF